MCASAFVATFAMYLVSIFLFALALASYMAIKSASGSSVVSVVCPLISKAGLHHDGADDAQLLVSTCQLVPNANAVSAPEPFV